MAEELEQVKGKYEKDLISFEEEKSKLVQELKIARQTAEE